jgi:hypothetical protein
MGLSVRVFNCAMGIIVRAFNCACV